MVVAVALVADGAASEVLCYALRGRLMAASSVTVYWAPWRQHSGGGKGIYNGELCCLRHMERLWLWLLLRDCSGLGLPCQKEFGVLCVLLMSKEDREASNSTLPMGTMVMCANGVPDVGYNILDAVHELFKRCVTAELPLICARYSFTCTRVY